MRSVTIRKDPKGGTYEIQRYTELGIHFNTLHLVTKDEIQIHIDNWLDELTKVELTFTNKEDANKFVKHMNNTEDCRAISKSVESLVRVTNVKIIQ